MPARQSLDTHVHELVVADERFQVLLGVPRGDVRVTNDAEAHRPEQVAHPFRDGGSRVQHCDVDICGRRTDPIRADQVDFDFRVIRTEVLQQRHHHVRGKARRHLHTQGAQPGCARVADLVDGMFEPVERARNDWQQVFAGGSQHQ